MLNLFSRLIGAHRAMDKETYIIVGLGNPGAKYAHTRHNCGFEVLQLLSDRLHCPLVKNRLKGLLGETTLSGKRIVLCQPQTMMNLSGDCVSPLLSWYKVPIDHLLHNHTLHRTLYLCLHSVFLQKTSYPLTNSFFNNLHSFIEFL